MRRITTKTCLSHIFRRVESRQKTLTALRQKPEIECLGKNVYHTAKPRTTSALRIKREKPRIRGHHCRQLKRTPKVSRQTTHSSHPFFHYNLPPPRNFTIGRMTTWSTTARTCRPGTSESGVHAIGYGANARFATMPPGYTHWRWRRKVT